jgi:hypothetical protein
MRNDEPFLLPAIHHTFIEPVSAMRRERKLSSRRHAGKSWLITQQRSIQRHAGSEKALVPATNG